MTDSPEPQTRHRIDERPDALGRPAALPGSARDQIREAIRRELLAWGYSPEAAETDPRRLPIQSLSTDLTGAILRLDIVRAQLWREPPSAAEATVERVQALHDRLTASPNDRAYYFAGLLRRALRGDGLP